jgi:transcriptional regulator
MIRKGRRVVGKLPSQVGECNHGSKLTEGVVRKIKSMYKRGDSQACISRKTKVPRANIWAIVNNKSWAHVTL